MITKAPIMSDVPANDQARVQLNTTNLATKGRLHQGETKGKWIHIKMVVKHQACEGDMEA